MKEVKSKQYFLRDDIKTYKKKYMLCCNECTYEVMRFKNKHVEGVIVPSLEQL